MKEGCGADTDGLLKTSIHAMACVPRGLVAEEMVPTADDCHLWPLQGSIEDGSCICDSDTRWVGGSSQKRRVS